MSSEHIVKTVDIIDSETQNLIIKSNIIEEKVKSEDLEEIKEELGDMFLHLIFQSQIYEEKDAFNFSEIIEKIDSKLKNLNH